MKSNVRAALILAHVVILPHNLALADSGWVNHQGCYCGTYNPYPVDFISCGSGSTAERNASRDQMIYWNRYCTIYTPSVDTGLGAPGNGLNEVNTFITSSDKVSIYGGNPMQPSLYGMAIIIPDANFGGFDDCDEFNATGCDDFTETDVIINAGFQDGWTTDPNDYSSALVQTTVLHEIGHTWGAHHVFTLSDFGDSYSTMNYINDDSGRFVTRMDANTIRAAYPDTVQTITDVGIFPFIFGNSDYAETYALISPTTAESGENITISNYLIQNIGNTVANNTVVGFYLSTDTTITTGDILLGTADFGNLAVDAQSDSSVTLTIPNNVAQGDYYIGAIVTVDSGADDITINNSFIIGRPARTMVTVGEEQCDVQNSGFESGTPNNYWTETSTNYGTPLCTTYYCGSGAPYSGNWWAWFGGAVGAAEEGSLEQTVTIKSSARYLNFYLEVPTAGTTGYLRVMLDGNTLLEVTEAHNATYGTYRAVSLDISSYADDANHALRLESRTEAGMGALNFFVDDLCFSATAIRSRNDGGASGCFIDSINR